MDDKVTTTSNGGYLGLAIGPGMVMFTWSGNEFVFGLRWTNGYVGLCAGPFSLGYIWENNQ